MLYMHLSRTRGCTMVDARRIHPNVLIGRNISKKPEKTPGEMRAKMPID